MAVEYILETRGDISLDDTLNALADRIGAEVGEDGFAQRSGLHMMSTLIPADEIETTEYLLGYRDVVSTTFRLLNNTDPADEQENLRSVLEAVVWFLDRTPTMRGVFTLEGERILLQRISGEPVVFDTGWRQYTLELPQSTLDAIEAGHRVATLPQPVLSAIDLESLKTSRLQ